MPFPTASTQAHGWTLGIMSAVYYIEAGLEAMKSSICNAAFGGNCFNTRSLTDPYPLNTPLFSPPTISEPHVVPPEATTPLFKPLEPLPFWPLLLRDISGLQPLVHSFESQWPAILAYFLCALSTLLFLRQVFVTRQGQLGKSILEQHFDSLGLSFYQLRLQVEKLLDLNKLRKRTIATLQNALSERGVRDLLSQVSSLEEAKLRAMATIEALNERIEDLCRVASQQKTAFEAIQEQLSDLQGQKSQLRADLETLGQRNTEFQQQYELEKTMREAAQTQGRKLNDANQKDQSQLQALQKELDDTRQTQSQDNDALQAAQKQLDHLQRAKSEDEGHRSTLERQLTDLQEDKNAGEADYQALEHEFDELSAHRMAAEDKAEKLQRDIDMYRKWKDDLETENDDLQLRHEQLEQQHGNLQRGHESQKLRIQRMEGSIQKKETEASKHREEMEQLEKQLETSDQTATARVQQELDAANRGKEEAVQASRVAQQQLEANAKDKDDQIRQMQADKAAADQGREAAEGKLSQAEATQKESDKQIAAQMEQLDQQKQVLETGKDSTTKIHDGLRQQVQQLQLQLEEQQEGRRAENELHSQQVKALEKDVEGAQAANKTANDDSSSAKQRCEELESERAEAKRESDVLKQELGTLRTSNATGYQQLQALQHYAQNMWDELQRKEALIKEQNESNETIQGLLSDLDERKEAEEAEAKKEIANLEEKLQQMQSERDDAQARIDSLMEPFDWQNDLYLGEVSAEQATAQLGQLPPPTVYSGGGLPQDSTMVGQEPADNINERIFQALTNFDDTSLAQGPSQNVQQEGNDNVGDLSMLDGEQAQQDPVETTGDTTIPASTFASNAQSLAEMQANAPQPTLPANVSPSALVLNNAGDPTAANVDVGSTLNPVALNDSSQVEVPRSDFSFAAQPGITTGFAMAGPIEAMPRYESLIGQEATGNVSHFKPPETNFLFSGKDAAQSARKIARPVTRDRAKRQRQIDWAASRNLQAQQAASNGAAATENAASASSAPTITEAAAAEEDEEADVDWEDVPTLQGNQQPGPSSTPAPPAAPTTGLAFEEPDISELDRAFADPTIPTYTSTRLTRRTGEEPNEDEDSDSGLSDAPSDPEDPIVNSDDEDGNTFSNPYNAPTPDFGIAHSPEIKPEGFDGPVDPEVAGSMRLDQEANSSDDAEGDDDDGDGAMPEGSGYPNPENRQRPRSSFFDAMRSGREVEPRYVGNQRLPTDAEIKADRVRRRAETEALKKKLEKDEERDREEEEAGKREVMGKEDTEDNFEISFD
ncbi:MAG: hypothetical protein Q9164_006523 [Protoblastenia rupestris]